MPPERMAHSPQETGVPQLPKNPSLPRGTKGVRTALRLDRAAITEHGPPGPPVFGFPLPAFAGTSSAGMTEESAGTRPCRGLGCPRIFFNITHEWGIEGVEATLLAQLFCHRRHAPDEEL
jgi:hypothetical protein